MLNVDQHGFTIDVFDQQVAQFAIPHAGGVEHHQQGAIHQVASRIEQPAHFFHTENDGQSPRHFREGDVLQQIATLERGKYPFALCEFKQTYSLAFS